MSFPEFFRRLALGRSSAAAAALLIGATGCITLHDTQPFTAATVGLQGAIASSGAAVAAELKAAPLLAKSPVPAELEGAWVARNEAMTALVAYARSLEDIAAAGRAGEDSARKLVEAAGAHDALLLGAAEERVAAIMANTAELAGLAKKVQAQTAANEQAARSIRLEQARKVVVASTDAIAAITELKKQVEAQTGAEGQVTVLGEKLGKALAALRDLRQTVETTG